MAVNTIGHCYCGPHQPTPSKAQSVALLGCECNWTRACGSKATSAPFLLYLDSVSEVG